MSGMKDVLVEAADRLGMDPTAEWTMGIIGRWVEAGCPEPLADWVREHPAVVVTVTIYSDNETKVDAPPGVTVNIEYADADGDETCGCGFTIYQDEDSGGRWVHRVGPEQWGGGHDASPN